jgi:hypothetical protein
MTFPFDPTTSPDITASAEQNVQLQPSSYQPAETQPTPSTPAASSSTSSSTSNSSSNSTSGSGSTDTVQLSYDAQVRQLSSQGLSAADIAQSMGSTIAAVDTLLNITPTSTTATTSAASTTPTVLL